MRRFLLALLILCGAAFPQQPLRASEITPPKAIQKTEPEYTREALNAYVQGTLVVEIAINEKGRAENISILSPIGFGLDEKARSAIEQWVFQPATKDGKPIKVMANVEVNFRLGNMQFDRKAEQRRTAFNLAIKAVYGPRGRESAAAKLEALAEQKFVPAIYAVGKLYETGDVLPKDPERALAMYSKAADKNYGPAMYEIGRRYLYGFQVPQDTERGMGLLRDAAVLGSGQAQFFLAARNEVSDPEAARRYFRLCAVTGEAECQFRLGKMLLAEADRPERHYIQAISWMQLAAESAHAGAKNVLEAELPKATAEQIKWAERLKPQLVRKQ